MFLTSQFPAQGFTQFWVSPPEFFEFRELNQSFSEVGAFTTGEVNLMAADRPRRVRSAAVTDELMRALQLQPAQGRLFAKGETDVTEPARAARNAAADAAAGRHPVPRTVAVRVRRPRVVGQTVEINGLAREVIGIMPPGADVMDNRTEVWLPLGLNPANRQNRGNHFLYLIGRLKDGVTPEAAQAELASLIGSWSERTGVKQHVFAPLTAPPRPGRPGLGSHPADGAGAGRDCRQRQPRHLGAAGLGRIRPADCLRQPRQPAAGASRDQAPRVRRAHGAGRRTRAAAAAVHDRRRAALGHWRRRWG